MCNKQFVRQYRHKPHKRKHNTWTRTQHTQHTQNRHSTHKKDTTTHAEQTQHTQERHNNTHKPKQTTTKHTPHHNNIQHHTDTERQNKADREREREGKMKERRQEKTNREKRERETYSNTLTNAFPSIGTYSHTNLHIQIRQHWHRHIYSDHVRLHDHGRFFSMSINLTFRGLHGNHIVSTPFETIVKKNRHQKDSSPTCPPTPWPSMKIIILLSFVSLILAPSPSLSHPRDLWSDCLMISQDDDKGQTNIPAAEKTIQRQYAEEPGMPIKNNTCFRWGSRHSLLCTFWNLWFWLRILEMTYVHQCSKVDCLLTFCASWITSFFCFCSWPHSAATLRLLELVPFLIHCVLRIRDLRHLWHRCTKLQCLI